MEYEKFSEVTRRVLWLAERSAKEWRQNYVGSEHLLLALLQETEGVASKSLVNIGVDIEIVKMRVATMEDNHDKPWIGLTDRTKRVIELAVEDARLSNYKNIGTGHLLTGIVKEDLLYNGMSL
jgi:ATP-dependent Clp protease ATP-binding subunit ClpC